MPDQMRPQVQSVPPQQAMSEEIDLFSLLSPEELEELLGLGTFGDRAQLLEEEMAQSRAMQQPRGGGYSTPGGAFFGALGDVVGAVGGSARADMVRGKQRALLDETDERRRILAELMGRQRAAPRYQEAMRGAGAGDVAPAGAFRLG